MQLVQQGQVMTSSLSMNKSTVVIFALLVAVSLANAADLEEAWREFKIKFQKEYRSADDEARKRIFATTHNMIEEHNNNNGVFKMEHNFFSDMTDREKSKFVGVRIPIQNITGNRESAYPAIQDDRQLPTSIDYRTDPCMSPVKQQGSCAAGWAFGAIASLEFSKCKKTCNTKILLSEQQLLDCTAGVGCGGGMFTTGWSYLTGGAAYQASYPYTAAKGTCKYTTSMLGAKVSTYGELPSKDAVAMQLALQNYGPIAVKVTTTGAFLSYKSGVFYDCNCNQNYVDHEVNIVGYGSDVNGNPYWILRNSWGTAWGDGGYMLIRRGVNMCNIELMPAYVVAA